MIARRLRFKPHAAPQQLHHVRRAPFAADNRPPARRCGLPTPAFSPLYQQIKGLILQSLQQGEWKPGESIPSEMELAARFRVSQGTVRKAIDELAAENLVVRGKGKGTFVVPPTPSNMCSTGFLKLLPDTATPAWKARQRP